MLRQDCSRVMINGWEEAQEVELANMQIDGSAGPQVVGAIKMLHKLKGERVW